MSFSASPTGMPGAVPTIVAANSATSPQKQAPAKSSLSPDICILGAATAAAVAGVIGCGIYGFSTRFGRAAIPGPTAALHGGTSGASPTVPTHGVACTSGTGEIRAYQPPPVDAAGRKTPDDLDQANFQPQQVGEDCAAHALDALTNGFFVSSGRDLARYRRERWDNHQRPDINEFVGMANERLAAIDGTARAHEPAGGFRALRNLTGYTIVQATAGAHPDALRGCRSTDVAADANQNVREYFAPHPADCVDRFAVLAQDHYAVIGYNRGKWRLINSLLPASCVKDHETQPPLLSDESQKKSAAHAERALQAYLRDCRGSGKKGDIRQYHIAVPRG